MWWRGSGRTGVQTPRSSQTSAPWGLGAGGGGGPCWGPSASSGRRTEPGARAAGPPVAWTDSSHFSRFHSTGSGETEFYFSNMFSLLGQHFIMKTFKHTEKLEECASAADHVPTAQTPQVHPLSVRFPPLSSGSSAGAAGTKDHTAGRAAPPAPAAPAPAAPAPAACAGLPGALGWGRCLVSACRAPAP